MYLLLNINTEKILEIEPGTSYSGYNRGMDNWLEYLALGRRYPGMIRSSDRIY